MHTTFTAGVAGGSHAVTCGQAPNDCAVLVSQLTDGSGFVTGAATPISFGADLTAGPPQPVRSAMTAMAALRPLIAITLPAGWVAAPQR